MSDTNFAAVEELLQNHRAKTEARVDMLLPENGRLSDSVVHAARHSLLDAGKRIRPLLLVEFYKLCGGEDECAYHFAAALEMIHTYSLIHDDLPCMDDDDMRRGKPSCHKQFGEATAVLAGDGLLTEAFGVAAKTVGLPVERILRAMGVLSSCAGISGMVGGQIIDLESENKQVQIETVTEMYRLKTGALIRAAATIGCILAGADEDLIEAASTYGEKMGLAFQVIDDILDFESTDGVLGKPVGSDEKNHKNTYVSLLGLEESRNIATQLTNEAITILERFSGDTNAIADLTKYLLSRNR
ncbi:MAG: polyprenyl synthetase family protein [Clostridia bacterium]|nr:polyprenyl synthetase family protein [Clostridia bacterium]